MNSIPPLPGPMTGTVYVGDVMAGLGAIPDNSVHCVVTSPPYWALRSYLNDDDSSKSHEIGSERTPELWVEKLVQVFREVKRVLHPTGVCWINIGDCYYSSRSFAGAEDKQDGVFGRVGKKSDGSTGSTKLPPHPTLKYKDLVGQPYRLAFGLQADGWYWRSDIAWEKPNATPSSVVDRPARVKEIVLQMTKTTSYFYDDISSREPDAGNAHARGRNENPRRMAKARGEAKANATNAMPGKSYDGTRRMRDVWSIPTIRSMDPEHKASFPPALAKKAIIAGSSAAGCCSRCFTPWKQVVVRQKYGDWHPEEGSNGDPTRPNAQTSERKGTKFQQSYVPPRIEKWEAGCSCPEARNPIPCRVLDPFAGTLATGLAAFGLGRSFLGCELDAEMAKRARDRFAKDSGLFSATMEIADAPGWKDGALVAFRPPV